MDTFGRYRLQFEPHPDDTSPSVTMEFSGQASLDQMLANFDAFLKANGYVYDGEVTILDEEPRPLFQMTAQGSQGVDFVPFSSSMADDVFTFGAG
jgi:hypothetical protein